MGDQEVPGDVWEVLVRAEARMEDRAEAPTEDQVEARTGDRADRVAGREVPTPVEAPTQADNQRPDLRLSLYLNQPNLKLFS